MRKASHFLLAFCLALLLSGHVNADTEEDLTFTLNNDGKSYCVTDCNTSADGELVIPSDYQGLPVTGIGSDAFRDCDSLTSVIIADSVTAISNYAFYSCDNLTSVTIPDSVKRIGYQTFNFCYNLTSVTIGKGVTAIDDYAFYNCDSLTGIWVDVQNPAFCSDEDGVLYNKDKTKLLQAPAKGVSGVYAVSDSVIDIGDNAFYNCESLTSVIIPDSVESIGTSAFQYCTGLISVSIGNGVTMIANSAFFYCTSLTSVTIPDSVTQICNSAFSHCSGLTAVTIPTSVESIDSLAFYYCNELRHIAYTGTDAQWANICIGSDNTALINAEVWHYEVKERTQYHYQNCVNAGSFCSLCNDFAAIEKTELGTHMYDNDKDIYCDNCGYTRTVKGIYISAFPTKTQFALLSGVLDTTGGGLLVAYSDQTYGFIDMTEEMVSGFDNRVYGSQTLTVTYDGCTTTYTVKCITTSAPDKLELLTKPDQTMYLLKQTVSLTGISLLATYGEFAIKIPASEVRMDALDMTTVGMKTVTVRFHDAVVTFPIYVHEKQTLTIDSSLYPESSHNYASNTNETKTFTYPGADQLLLTFSSQSYTESSYDFVYIMDGAGNQIGKYSGSLYGKMVIVPGDTMQITLTSDNSVNKYGYAFSSIVAETVLHPGNLFCEICGKSKLEAGQTAVLTENITLDSLSIPTNAVLDLNGQILSVNSLVSFGQIIDSVGGGGLIVENIEITGNAWLPIQDSTGCYRFYEYKMVSLGTKNGTDFVIFGFALDFMNGAAYTDLLETNDVQINVTLNWERNSKTFAFSKDLIQRYVELQSKYPQLRPYLKLNVTGTDSLTSGTVLTVTPTITSVAGKIQNIGAPITHTA